METNAATATTALRNGLLTIRTSFSPTRLSIQHSAFSI
jgi:hypothetical protein